MSVTLKDIARRACVDPTVVSAMTDMLLSRLEDPSLPPRCRKIKAELKTITGGDPAVTVKD